MQRKSNFPRHTHIRTCTQAHTYTNTHIHGKTHAHTHTGKQACTHMHEHTQVKYQLLLTARCLFKRVLLQLNLSRELEVIWGLSQHGPYRSPYENGMS